MLQSPPQSTSLNQYPLQKPFAGLTVFAVIGLLLGELVGSIEAWSFLFIVFSLLWLVCNKDSRFGQWIFFIFVLTAFATLHAWRNEKDSSRMLAQRPVFQEKLLVEGEAVVLEQPVLIQDRNPARPRSRFQVELIRLNGYPVRARALLLWNGTPPEYGDLLRFRGTLENIAPARNPGQFDAPKYYSRFHIFSRITVRHRKDGQILSHHHGNRLRAVAISVREKITRYLHEGLEEDLEIGDIISGMVLGGQLGISDEVQAMFQHTGTLHLFAVSGLHVGMVTLLMYKLLTIFRVPRRSRIFLILGILLFYAFLTGLRPPVLRAGLMMGIVLCGFLADRPVSLFNNLAAAAFLLLLYDGNQLFMLGFQLSFCVVFAILLLAGRFGKQFEKVGYPDSFLPKKIWNWREKLKAIIGGRLGQWAAVSLAAAIGSMPLIWIGFHLVTPISVLANMIIVPMAFPVLALGLASVFVAPFSVFISSVFNNANWLVMTCMLCIIKLFSGIPGGYFQMGLPRLPEKTSAELTVFDLGTGGAIALDTKKEHWLIDTGNTFAMQNIVMPALQSQGVNQLDGIVLTYGNIHRIGGAVLCEPYLNPKRFLESSLPDRSPTRKKIYQLLAEKQVLPERMRMGDSFKIGNMIQCEVLYPPSDVVRRFADEKALVLLLTIGETRLLLLSDAPFSTEQYLIERYPDLRCDIVIKGCPVSDQTDDSTFITHLKPQVVITTQQATDSSDKKRAFVSNLPTIRHFDQTSSGAIRLRFYRDGFEADSFLTKETFRSRNR